MTNILRIQNYSTYFLSKMADSGKESILIGVAAGGMYFMNKNYSPPITGLFVGFFMFRLISNLFQENDNYFSNQARKFEATFPWLTPSVMLVSTLFFSPEYSNLPLLLNSTMWIGILSGSFFGITYSRPTQENND